MCRSKNRARSGRTAPLHRGTARIRPARQDGLATACPRRRQVAARSLRAGRPGRRRAHGLPDPAQGPRRRVRRDVRGRLRPQPLGAGPVPGQRLPSAWLGRAGLPAGAPGYPVVRDARTTVRRPEAGRGASGNGPRHRADRVGEDDHDRGHDRPHQRDQGRQRGHHRGPDRGAPRRQDVDREPAGDRHRHRRLRDGDEARVAAGPGRHLHRRDARSGDGVGRPGRRRDRPPGAVHLAHDERGGDGQPDRRLLPAPSAEAGSLVAGLLAPRRDQPAAPRTRRPEGPGAVHRGAGEHRARLRPHRRPEPGRRVDRGDHRRR